MFMDNDKLPRPEYLDQIFPLNASASSFLWKYSDLIKLGRYAPDSGRYFRSHKRLVFGNGMERDVKKWLFQCGVPFDTPVFIPFQPDVAFAMTWKMLIRYSADLFFGHDLVVWDASTNWALYYDHNDVFYFAWDRIYDGEQEKLDLDELIRSLTNGAIGT